MTSSFMRNPGLAMYAAGDAVHLLRPGRPETVITVADPSAVAAALDSLVTPVDAEALAELIAPDTARALIERDVILEGSFDELSALVPEPPARAEPIVEHLVVGISGSVASVHAPTVLLELLHGFAQHVDVIVTDAASRFVRPEAFAYLGAEVWTDDFLPRGEVNVPHIHLARSADVIVVWPASAATIAKLAHGSCNDLLSLTITASDAPTVLFPAMNHAMWTDRAVARNVAQLRDDGRFVVEPGPGYAVADRGGGELATGAAGSGAFGLADIVASVLRAAG